MRLYHVGLVCSSEAASDRFYGELLGLTKVGGKHLDAELAAEIFDVPQAMDFIYYGDGDGGLTFEVFLAPNLVPAGPHVPHTCLEFDDMVTLMTRAEIMGYALKRIPKGAKTLFFLSDDDGNLFELKQRV